MEYAIGMKANASWLMYLGPSRTPHLNVAMWQGMTGDEVLNARFELNSINCGPAQRLWFASGQRVETFVSSQAGFAGTDDVVVAEPQIRYDKVNRLSCRRRLEKL